MSSLWSDLVENGRKNQSHPEINVLDKDDIISIIATIEYFGASDVFMKQIYFDLANHGMYAPKYKLFDALAMYVDGRADDSEDNIQGLKVLCHAFITSGYNEKKFIENIRVNDYEVVRDWEALEISW